MIGLTFWIMSEKKPEPADEKGARAVWSANSGPNSRTFKAPIVDEEVASKKEDCPPPPPPALKYRTSSDWSTPTTLSKGSRVSIPGAFAACQHPLELWSDEEEASFSGATASVSAFVGDCVATTLVSATLVDRSPLAAVCYAQPVPAAAKTFRRRPLGATACILIAMAVIGVLAGGFGWLLSQKKGSSEPASSSPTESAASTDNDSSVLLWNETDLTTHGYAFKSVYAVVWGADTTCSKYQRPTLTLSCGSNADSSAIGIMNPSVLDSLSCAQDGTSSIICNLNERIDKVLVLFGCGGHSEADTAMDVYVPHSVATHCGEILTTASGGIRSLQYEAAGETAVFVGAGNICSDAGHLNTLPATGCEQGERVTPLGAPGEPVYCVESTQCALSSSTTSCDTLVQDLSVSFGRSNDRCVFTMGTALDALQLVALANSTLVEGSNLLDDIAHVKATSSPVPPKPTPSPVSVSWLSPALSPVSAPPPTPLPTRGPSPWPSATPLMVAPTNGPIPATYQTEYVLTWGAETLCNSIDTVSLHMKCSGSDIKVLGIRGGSCQATMGNKVACQATNEEAMALVACVDESSSNLRLTVSSSAPTLSGCSTWQRRANLEEVQVGGLAYVSLGRFPIRDDVVTLGTSFDCNQGQSTVIGAQPFCYQAATDTNGLVLHTISAQSLGVCQACYRAASEAPTVEELWTLAEVGMRHRQALLARVMGDSSD